MVHDDVAARLRHRVDSPDDVDAAVVLGDIDSSVAPFRGWSEDLAAIQIAKGVDELEICGRRSRGQGEHSPVGGAVQPIVGSQDEPALRKRVGERISIERCLVEDVEDGEVLAVRSQPERRPAAAAEIASQIATEDGGAVQVSIRAEREPARMPAVGAIERVQGLEARLPSVRTRKILRAAHVPAGPVEIVVEEQQRACRAGWRIAEIRTR